MTEDRRKFATLALHGAAPPRRFGAAVSPAIETATSFYADPEGVGFSANDLDGEAPPFYTRWGNPTVALLEARLAQFEQGAGAVAFASGMAAISALFSARLKAGDHLLISDVCYAGAAELAQDLPSRRGVEATAVDASNPEAVAAAIRPGQTKLLHVETPANPILRLADLARLAEIAHGAGAEISVDSTIATPIATRPLEFGADYVVHSLTKYICGHGDALGGAVVAKDPAALKDLRGALIHQGGALSPLAAWLILRGLETLPLRMERHEANARKLAEFLKAHPAVDKVLWPGLEDHPQAALARRQMENFSGLLSFTIRGPAKPLAARMAKELRTISYAVSLGKSKSLIFFIPTEDLLRSSFRMTPDSAAAYRATAGEGVFRFSVGLEDAEDLIADLDRLL